MKKNKILKYDCRYFEGDKPCVFHKNYNIKCDSCNNYLPIEFKILIIKLDAIGDVLRTTSILPVLKNKYPSAHITWCTRFQAREIFINNNLVDELIFIDEDAYFRLTAEEFDLVVNLDTSKFSSSIASSVTGKTKVGFKLNKRGYVESTSEEADKWLLMSAFDDVKKENKSSYQKIIYDILGLKSNIELPVLNIPEEISKMILNKSKAWKLKQAEQTIGLNIGVGTKWPSKSWPLQRWEELITSLKDKSLNLLLLGGPDENGKISHLADRYTFTVNTGCDNSVMEFAAIVGLCDILITADTFALHIGNSLNKKIVALFGPTSHNEIDLYESGIKIVSSKVCQCYYKRECTELRSCMSEIMASEVLAGIESLLD